MKLSMIFMNNPDIGWGSRGNPHFWEHLKKSADSMLMPITDDELETWIKNEHLKLTGEELTPESDVYFEAYDHGGMSAGRITGNWWYQIGIPLLRERNKSCGMNQSKKKSAGRIEPRPAD